MISMFALLVLLSACSPSWCHGQHFHLGGVMVSMFALVVNGQHVRLGGVMVSMFALVVNGQNVRLGDVMITMLALCMTNRVFETLSNQTKDLFMAEHAPLTSQSKYWLYLACKV